MKLLKDVDLVLIKNQKIILINISLIAEMVKKVCKSEFINTYAITEARVRTLCSLLSLGQIPQDKRGLKKSNFIPETIVETIIHHI